MNFMDAMNKTLGTLPYNKSITENGAIGYASTQHYLLDMNFKTASYRNKSDREITRDFTLAYNENPLLAIKWLFYARDVRGGMGERKLFRVCMKHLAVSHPEIVKKLLPLFAEYGRWDDVVDMIYTQVQPDVVELIKKQWTADMIAYNENKPFSLLCKWLPSVNTSSKETVAKAKLLVKELGCPEKTYRQTLSALRERLKVVERDMSAKNWEGINYEAVPSKANLIYNGAFLRSDEERRRAYLAALEKGEAKINGSTNFPHEVFTKIRNGRATERKAIEALWKALPNYNLEGTLVVVDGSGSMTSPIGGTRTTAWDVSNALGIYCAERNHGEFKDKFITFSSKPELVDISNCKTLTNKYNVCRSHNDCSNTNIQATFELILKTAVRNNMAQEDMPKNVLIISDMEFDSFRDGGTDWWGDVVNLPKLDKALFERIADKFTQAGYKMPRLSFWNVASRTNTIPVMENDLGVTLVSGFSPAVLKMVMSDCLDPYENLVSALSAERYQAVEDALKD